MSNCVSFLSLLSFGYAPFVRINAHFMITDTKTCHTQLLDTSPVRLMCRLVGALARARTNEWTLADQIVTVRRTRRTHTQQTICSNHACRVDYMSIGKQNSGRRQPEVIRKKLANFMAKSNKPFAVQSCQVFRVLFALVFLAVLGVSVCRASHDRRSIRLSIE